MGVRKAKDRRMLMQMRDRERLNALSPGLKDGLVCVSVCVFSSFCVCACVCVCVSVCGRYCLFAFTFQCCINGEASSDMAEIILGVM